MRAPKEAGNQDANRRGMIAPYVRALWEGRVRRGGSAFADWIGRTRPRGAAEKIIPLISRETRAWAAGGVFVHLEARMNPAPGAIYEGAVSLGVILRKKLSEERFVSVFFRQFSLLICAVHL